MTLFITDEVLSPSPSFTLVAEGENYFFLHDSGQKVEIDRLGKAIWESLPERVGPLRERIQREYTVSERFLEEFLYVLGRAQVIRSSSWTAEEVIRTPEAKDFSQELISVIVITYNAEPHLQDCFRSIFSQTYRNLEVIAVDNGSQDQTVMILEEQFPRVSILELKKNLHIAGGVNQGIRKAQGDYFFILNQDVELEKDCVLSLYLKMKEEENCGAVVPLMKFFHLRGFVNGLGNHIRDQGWGSDNFIGCVDIGQFQSLREVPSACFGAVFLSRKAIEQAGLLDVKYQSYYEDVDWSFRCWLRGLKIVPAPNAVVYHKFGASYTDKKKLRLVVRNRLRLVLKLFEGKLRYVFLKRYFKEDLINSLSLMRKKDFGLALSYFKGYFSLFLSLPDIFFKRRKILKRKPRLNVADILMMNPSFYSCLNEKNIPAIDSQTMFGYYRGEFARLKKTQGYEQNEI